MKLLIRNGTVIDPANGLHAQADVLVEDGRIAEVSANGIFCAAAEELDAEGLTVCPGFIDIHMHEDPVVNGRLYADPERAALARLLRMGVTAGLAGNCGENAAEPAAYLRLLEQRGSLISLGLLAGHSDLRKRFDGGDPYAQLDAQQTGELAASMAAAVRQGCYGISFGLEYTPGTTPEELLLCIRRCAPESDYLAAHIRGCAEDAAAAAEEVILAGREAGADVQISHVGSMGAYGQMAELLTLLDAYASTGMRLFADCYPYTAFSTYIGSAPYDDLEKIHCRYEDIMLCEGRYKGLPCTKEIFEEERRAHPDYLTVGSVMRAEEVRAALLHPRVLPCSDATLNFGSGHPRASGAFPRFYDRMVRGGLMTEDEAIRRMTALPAQRLGWSRKGKLSAGSDADIVIFDPAEFKDRADFTEPLRDPAGIRTVIVNGKVAFRDGRILCENAGRLLKKENG